MKNRLLLTTVLSCFSIAAYSQTSTSIQKSTVQEVSELETASHKKGNAVVGQKKVIMVAKGYSIDNQIQDVKDKVNDIESNPEKYKNADALLIRYRNGISLLESKKYHLKNKTYTDE
tara:strand:+ start:334 stop:684 length:351 start_codon:yes stop_codon:yes gene_type:complete